LSKFQRKQHHYC